MTASRGAAPDRRRALVTRSARWRVVSLALVAGAATALLGWHYAGDTRGGHLDRALVPLLAAPHGPSGRLAQTIADLGDPAPIAVGLLVVAVLAWFVRGGRGLALVLTGPPLAMVLTTLVLKPIVGRTHTGDLAFPSGHTTAVSSIAVAVAVLLLGTTALPRLARRLGVGALAALVVAVAVALVARNYHYPTDTLGGFGVSVTVVLITALVVDGWADLLVDGARDERTEGPTEVLPRARAHPHG